MDSFENQVGVSNTKCILLRNQNKNGMLGILRMSSEKHTYPKKQKHMLFENIIHFLQKDETLQKLHLYILDPLLNHILERVFPYIVLTCVLFGLLLILVMCTFAVLLLQMKNASSPGSTLYPV
jgi:hypothetical protein